MILRKTFIIGLFAGIGFWGHLAAQDNDEKLFELSKNMEIFANIYQELNTHYVDELNPSQMMRIGIDAMLGSLDPYTNYFSESEIEGYRYQSESGSKGIGANFIKIDGEVTITAPYENSPASKAGLKAGDVLIAVDGQQVADKRSEDVNRFLEGFPGTEVVLTIRRPGTNKTENITLVREEVNIDNVPYFGMLDDETGYVALTTFTRNAGRNVANAVKKLKENNPGLKGVVFDLRGNGGGLLSEAVNVSNVFVDKDELVVTTRGKVIEWDRSYKTQNKPVDTDIPLVVLIDESSASASEIVSGVIQDFDRGVLVGQRSYGKGLVQNTQSVGYNSRVKLTIAKYYIPSGRCIQGVEYEDGEPVNIPDSLRTVFKTRGGREVLDGGGVKPDVFLDKTASNRIINSLNREHLIFEYVTKFCLANESIASPEDFHFEQYDDFVQFLEEKNFSYDTESEKALKQLKEKAASEDYDEALAAGFQQLEAQILEAKKNDLYEFQAEITNQIEKEIVSRYYFEKGKIQIGLRNDPEVKEAINLIKNLATYHQLLGK